MQEKLLECFVGAYYTGDIYDPHEYFAELLTEDFDVYFDKHDAECIANKIAKQGVTICKSGDEVLGVLG